jgi:hypothetical protein
LLATGASPRRLDLPSADLDGLHYLRQVEDSERLREAIRSGGRVVIVGGGWIGLETAAAAREYGCEVTVIEPRPTPLQAVFGPGTGGRVIGGFFAQVHRQHGVDVRLGTAVAEFRGAGWVTAVVTDVGGEIPADVVIVHYDVGMESTGWLAPGGYDALVTRGDLEARAFHAFWLCGDRVVAGMQVNQWDEGIAPVHDLIRSAMPIDRHRLGDPTVPLADMITSYRVQPSKRAPTVGGNRRGSSSSSDRFRIVLQREKM